MRCLVVGGSGQDGILLSAQLLADGHAVVCVSRRPSPLTDVDNRRLDITDCAGVDAIVDEVKPDNVYYLAAFHRASADNPPAVHEDVAGCLAVNTTAFGSLLASIARHAPAARTLYASSSRVFGPSNGSLVNEESIKAPDCAYGFSKLVGMQLAAFYRQTQNLFVSSAILFNHESELRSPSFLAKKLALAALAAKVDVSSRVQLLSVDDRVDWGSARDYVAAMRCILSMPESGEYVVASGCTRTVAEFAEACFASVGRDWRTHVTCTRSKSNAVRHPCGDAGRLRANGWRPRFTFTSMIDDLVRRVAITTQGGRLLSSNFRDYL